MRITTRTRYAIRALYDLAFHRLGQAAGAPGLLVVGAVVDLAAELAAGLSTDLGSDGAATDLLDVKGGG